MVRISFKGWVTFLLGTAVVCLSASGAQAALLCDDSFETDIAPFYVSSLKKRFFEQGADKKLYAVISPNDVQPENNRKLIPLSLVRPTEDSFFEVLSVPNLRSFERMSAHPKLKVSLGNLPHAEPGLVGRVEQDDLRDVTEFLYATDASTRFVRVSQVGANFTAKECCSRGSNGECELQYLFESVDGATKKVINTFWKSMDNKSFAQMLHPVPIHEIQSVGSFIEMVNEDQIHFKSLEYLDDTGFLKIPLHLGATRNERHEDHYRQLIPGPINTFHYGPDDRYVNDIFAHPAAACALFSAIEKFNKHCDSDACRVQFGDFFHPKEWGAHSSHGSGHCVDIRPIRTQMGFGPVNYVTRVDDGPWYVNPLYDFEKTQILVNYFIEAGGVGASAKQTGGQPRKIYFNDTKRLTGVQRMTGHSDHMHVCFPPDSDTVRSACL